MSLVIAEIEDGVVYMGADTQSTIGETDRECFVTAGNMKINKMPNGILLGHAGKARSARIISCHREWFEQLPEGKLTKEFIVTEIVPKFYEDLKKRNLLKQKEPAESGCSIFFAQGDKLFRMSSNFAVFIVPKRDALGCGNEAYYPTQALTPDLPVRQRMINTLRLAERHDTAVGAPFVFIDTKNFEYEFVEE